MLSSIYFNFNFSPKTKNQNSIAVRSESCVFPHLGFLSLSKLTWIDKYTTFTSHSSLLSLSQPTKTNTQAPLFLSLGFRTDLPTYQETREVILHRVLQKKKKKLVLLCWISDRTVEFFFFFSSFLLRFGFTRRSVADRSFQLELTVDCCCMRFELFLIHLWLWTFLGLGFLWLGDWPRELD